MKAKISVVTIVFNDNRNIEYTIKNVISQTYDNFEYIIIDGGSTDGTLDIIRKYKDSIAFLISEPDKGIYDAMNKSLNYCSGDYIIFMNSGDSFASHDSIRKVFSDIQTSDVIYGDAMYYYNNNPIKVVAKDYQHLKYEMPFNHQATFVKTELLRNCPFDTKYRYAADYNFFHNLYVNGHTFHHIDECISSYRLDGGASQKNIWKCYKEVAKISKARDIKYFCILIHAFSASIYYTIFNQKILNVLRNIKYS